MDGHQHMGHEMPMPMDGPMCSMNMLWNHDVKDVCVVFTSWHIRGPFTMILSCVAISLTALSLIIILIAVAYASLNTYIRTYDKVLAYSLQHQHHQQHDRSGLVPPIPNSYGGIDPPSGRSGLTRLSTRTRAIRAGLYAASVAVSFWLMLVAMTYNTYLFGSIVIGAFIGHMMYEPDIDVSAVLASGNARGLACH